MLTSEPTPASSPARIGSAFEVWSAFLKLGLTSFGGPVAHLGYFRIEFVERRRWIDDARFGELIALCQFLPGPASSQLGFVLGLLRAGWAGAIAAFVAFTLPSAFLLFAFSIASDRIAGPLGQAALHGLKLAAVAVVGHAVVAMARTLAPDLPRVAIAVVAAAVLVSWNAAWGPLLLLATAAAIGPYMCRSVTSHHGADIALRYGRRTGATLLIAFAMLLALAFALAARLPPLGQVAAAFFRAGALVFGGGHVVLPMLHGAVVEPGWIDKETFLTGYGAAQAVPGPMFSLAAFLGAKLQGGSGGAVGAVTVLLAIFLPGLLLVSGVLPFWRDLRRHASAARMMAGVNAAVVGVLVSALYDPLWKTAVNNGFDAGVAIAAFVLLLVSRRAALLVVVLCVAAAMIRAEAVGW